MFYSKNPEMAGSPTSVELQWLEHRLDHGNLVLDTGSWGHCELIIAPGQEANGDNLGMSFRSYVK